MKPAEFDEDRFLDRIADRLVGLPGVEAVALGGSRAEGTHTPESDWDLAVYYRGRFEPADLRALGWPGEVSELGAWGGGVFNGGAWLTVEGRAVDVHYRDLDVVERALADARRGRYRREVLLFHLAGIPTYLLVAELAVNRVLRGALPSVGGYPEALRARAGREWYEAARLTLSYAAGHARRGARTEVAGAVAVAAAQAAHAVLALRGEWVTNEKRLLDRAGLRGVDDVFDALGHTSEPAGRPARLRAALERAEGLCAEAVDAARASSG
ncbi:nucleotidyltransferase domain-containing protein [Streptomyces alkaliterrae]|uniref:Nucleotidyltransferase domain-containing protein n=1 Tax=Streptomyces alkaliterrae TaxID=2213162 RepID=A0A5P0YUZ6_9ACTN|nr:nucleotidyltransferase domain-containing protein [Streptomyces alkaliterrae]MBB1254996.1 nucleotidyltransferase domain-containing protein [Streptomyces alkaliterrae]MBB1261303.1 nucleotidyltransferase domain-containing protein [Streptomyces alkaliterrae]MQS04113.1 nucleotidyltransferase domain-containing protein [Streptomyces alkaliterrae]